MNLVSFSDDTFLKVDLGMAMFSLNKKFIDKFL